MYPAHNVKCTLCMFDISNQATKRTINKREKKSINACANSKDMHFELKFIDYKT